MKSTGRGRYQKVAVDCWFTSTGKTIPRMIKYQDEEGCIHLLKNLQVHQWERRQSLGILVQSYKCSVEINGVRRYFILLYHPGENTWDMGLAE